VLLGMTNIVVGWDRLVLGLESSDFLDTRILNELYNSRS
jgi:hypothetical protein